MVKEGMKIALFGFFFCLKLLMQVQTKLFPVFFLSLSSPQIRELHVVLRWMTEKEDVHHKKDTCLLIAQWWNSVNPHHFGKSGS